MESKRFFNRIIAIPQDHGAWVFLLSPLLIGLFIGKTIRWDTLLLVIASFMIFLVRQPITILVKSFSGRRTSDDLPVAFLWTCFYTVIILASFIGLVLLDRSFVLLIFIPGIPVFCWHLFLVSRRRERQQAGLEMIATGILSLIAPAALWVGKDAYDPSGWTLWLLIWLQSSASIVHAYMRLKQRTLESLPPSAIRWRMAYRPLVYTSFNTLFVLGLFLTHLVTPFVILPFLLQWAETIWGCIRPAIGWKPTTIGIRQLIVSTLFTILFILTWR